MNAQEQSFFHSVMQGVAKGFDCKFDQLPGAYGDFKLSFFKTVSLDYRDFENREGALIKARDAINSAIQETIIYKDLEHELNTHKERSQATIEALQKEVNRLKQFETHYKFQWEMTHGEHGWNAGTKAD